MSTHLLPSHPYKKYLREKGSVSILKVGDGYEVRWRDFSTARQKRFFNDRTEAEAFAEKVHAGEIESDIRDLCESDVAEYNQFWERQ